MLHTSNVDPMNKGASPRKLLDKGLDVSTSAKPTKKSSQVKASAAPKATRKRNTSPRKTASAKVDPTQKGKEESITPKVSKASKKPKAVTKPSDKVVSSPTKKKAAKEATTQQTQKNSFKKPTKESTTAKTVGKATGTPAVEPSVLPPAAASGPFPEPKAKNTDYSSVAPFSDTAQVEHELITKLKEKGAHAKELLVSCLKDIWTFITKGSN